MGDSVPITGSRPGSGMSERPLSAPSSSYGNGPGIYPYSAAAVRKSKLSIERRAQRKPKGGALSTSSGLISEEGEEGVNGMQTSHRINEFAQKACDYDYDKQIKPDTAASETLVTGAQVYDEVLQLNKIMKLLDITDPTCWYAEAMGETTHKRRLRQLTKLFYQRYETPSIQGMLYTYKLMLGGLQNRLEDFVLLAVPPGFNIRTTITRVRVQKGVTGGVNPMYYMHLDRQGPGDRKCLLLVAKTKKQFRGVGYVICTDPVELNEESEYCVGKIDSNFIGTEFTLYSGRSTCTDVPLDKGALKALPKVERFKEELVTVLYDPNVFGFKGPRKVKFIMPKMKNVLEREAVIPRISHESLLNQYRNEETGSVWCLKNKDPIWNQGTHSYILDFAGRVNRASVKNFQIVSENDEDHIMLQCGRVSENSFILDFHYPFCPLQAFAIALTSFGTKLACE